MSISADSKVKVSVIPGGAGALGEMNPVVGMVTDQGTIINIAGLPVVSVSGAGVGLPRSVYAGELTVTQDVASGTFSWPSGDGSIVYGHGAVFASGVPLDANPTQGVYMPVTGIPTAFDR